jgi:CubicO group peptidase (beta-lactamase class C family)
MSGGRVDLRRRLVPRLIALAALSVSIGASSDGLAQLGPSERAGASGAQTSSSETVSHLLSFLAEKYPSLRALGLVRGNCLAFEHYRKDIGVDTRSRVHSVAKSVLSILVGIALDQGYLRLDQKLSELLAEVSEAPVDPRVRDITVRDLLTMTSGFDPNGSSKIGMPGSETWRRFINRPMLYSPGSHFNYDDSAADLTSVVLRRAVGRDPERFAQQNLFDPMRIANYRWISDSEGNLIMGDALSLTARDMAKIGILYLQHGRWGGRQLVSSEFVTDSTTKHNEGGAPTHASYGYMWWTRKTKTGLEAFFAAGTDSQSIYIVPKLELVVAMAAGPGVPEGSQEFINNIVLPAATTLPSAPACIARLGE